MAKIKKLKVKGADGNFGEYIALGADAANVDLADGTTVEVSINTIKQDANILDEKVSTLNTDFVELKENTIFLDESLEEIEGQIGGIDYNTLLNKPDLTIYEEKTNKTTTLSAQSTDEQYPSAKAVYDIIGNVEQLLADLNSGGGVTE